MQYYSGRLVGGIAHRDPGAHEICAYGRMWLPSNARLRSGHVVI